MYEEIKFHKTETNPKYKALMEEELTASDGEREPYTGGGQRSSNLLEDMNSQHLVEEELTASDAVCDEYSYLYLYSQISV